MQEHKLSCASCRFCEDIGDESYVCRRYPPTLIRINEDFFSLYPPILNKDHWWCGEYTQPFSAGSN